MQTITQRIDHVTHIPPEWRATVLPAPPSCKWELFSGCSYACSYCSIDPKNKNHTMDMGLFKRATREAREFGTLEAGVFFVGESTLVPTVLTEAIGWCKSIGYDYVFLTTNGANLDPDLARACFRAGLDSLKFSVNAADHEQFREVMRVKPAMFDRALANLRDAWRIRNDEGFECKISASSIAFNGDQAARMDKLLAEKVLPFVDSHYFLPNFQQMSSVHAEKNRAMGFAPNAGNVGRDAARVPVLPCWSLFRESHVRWNGMMSACCFGANSRWDCGDLNTQSFAECWNSPAYQKLRAAHLAGDVHGTECAQCVYGEETTQ